MTMTTMNDTTNNLNTNTLPIPSTDLLSLLQSHLTECGLHATSSTLRIESGGVALPGLFPSTKTTLLQQVHDGKWGEVLNVINGLDLDRERRGYLDDYWRVSNQSATGAGDDAAAGKDDQDSSYTSRSSSIITPLEKAVALAHEMTILELAEQNEIELAYATLRMCSELLDKCLSVNEGETEGEHEHEHGASTATTAASIGMMSSRSGDIERRITALSSLRRSTPSTAATSELPPNYYGQNSNNNNPSKQKQRDAIAKLFKKHVPEIPLKRLSTLLQQSIKWQCHTGVFPTVQRLFANDHDPQQQNEKGDEGDDQNQSGKKSRKKRKNKHHITDDEQKIDLILGNVRVHVSTIDGKKKRSKKGDDGAMLSTTFPSTSAAERRIPSKPHQSIRLGKKSYIESAIFIPDGSGLITGSSDGFIEVWGEPLSLSSTSVETIRDDAGAAAAANAADLLPSSNIDYEKLRTADLPYQKSDDLMMHDTAVLSMAVSNDGTLLGSTSNDGTVCVWKIGDGKLLRKMERAHGGVGGVSDKGAAVTCIQFSPDGSKILTGGHDSTCREFGLLTSRMLKEFRGHKSYVNCCSYVILPQTLLGGGSSSSGGGGNNVLAVVTASADGSVRVWDGRTAEPIREITPPIPTSANAVIDDKESIVSSKSIHSVLHLHTPANTMIVVPRADRAYLMSYSGVVLRVFTRDDVQGTDFLAATVSTSNQWLFVAADDGKCVTFDVTTGNVEKIIRSFAEECSSGRSERPCDISGLICHPNRGFVGGYSNDKGQKRGILTLWK